MSSSKLTADAKFGVDIGGITLSFVIIIKVYFVYYKSNYYYKREFLFITIYVTFKRKPFTILKQTFFGNYSQCPPHRFQ